MSNSDSLDELTEALESGDDYSRVLDQHVSYAPTLLGVNAFYFIAVGLYLLVAMVGIVIVDIVVGVWVPPALMFAGVGLSVAVAQAAAPSRYGLLQYVTGKIRKHVGAQTYQTTQAITGDD